MIGHQAKHHDKKYTYWISEPEQSARADRTPVLLIHGFGGTYSGLEGLSDILTKQTTVLGLDLPGYGLSEPLNAKHTLANYARFLDEFCRTTEFHQIDVIGHSFGADIALVFASMFPHRVRKLVLLSPVILGDRRKARLGKQYYDLVARMPRGLRHSMLHNHFLTWATDHIMFRQASDRQRAKILRDDYISDHLMSDRPVLESFRSIYSTRFLHIASNLQVPTLIIVGEDDPLAPVTDLQKLHDMIGGSELEVVAGAGHFLPLETPRKVAGSIGIFLGYAKSSKSTAL